MAVSVNKVILIGHVGQEPDIKTVGQNNLLLASFSVATSRKPKNGYQVTQWHNCVAFGKTAQIIQQIIHKGSKIYVEGELDYQHYEKDGEKRTATKIMVRDISALSPGAANPSQPKKETASSGTSPTYGQDFADADIPW